MFSQIKIVLHLKVVFANDKSSYLMHEAIGKNSIAYKKMFCYFLYRWKDEIAFLVRREMVPRCGIRGFREMKPYGKIAYNLKHNSIQCAAIKILVLR